MRGFNVSGKGRQPTGLSHQWRYADMLGDEMRVS